MHPRHGGFPGLDDVPARPRTHLDIETAIIDRKARSMTARSYRFPTAEGYRAFSERVRRERARGVRYWLRALRLRLALPDFGPDTPEPRRP